MADLPSGAVTFVFTDIEGSTQLVRQLRDRYAGALAEHQRLVRAAFTSHGGHEIDTQGDAFFYAFASAPEAVIAAVEAQLALSSHHWPEDSQLKIRIGVHTGAAKPADGRYTGLAVHRGARICAAGHGGQILVSQATQSLIEDEEDHLAVSLLDLGDQRLKDIARPVRLYQVIAPGLQTEFPPLRGDAPEAPSKRVWRRRWPVAVAALALLAAATAAVILTRGTTNGLSAVQPNHVGLIDPQTNEIVGEVSAGIRPGPVAVGGGAVWVGNLDERTLTKIDARRRAPAGTFPLDNRTPTGVAVGAGSVWVAHGAVGQLSAVDPEFGQVTKTMDVAGEAIGSTNGTVAVGAAAVWAVFADSTLGRIDPSTLSVTGTATTASAPAGVVVAGGYVWVVNSDSANVQRFDPATFEQGPLGTPISVGVRPTAIAAGEGAIWVANTGSDTVTRIDPGSAGAAAATSEPIRVGDAPAALAVGAGSVWVANSGDGTITRIDATTREVRKTIEVGNAPSGIGFGAGIVWVSIQSP